MPAKADVTITPSYDAGTFQFESTSVGTHYLNYVVTDGTQSTTGVVRVDVVAPPDSNTKPITIPQTVFVRTLTLRESSMSPTRTSIPRVVCCWSRACRRHPRARGITRGDPEAAFDPRHAHPSRSTRPSRSTTPITNGLASATGTVTVIEIPTPTQACSRPSPTRTRSRCAPARPSTSRFSTTTQTRMARR